MPIIKHNGITYCGLGSNIAVDTSVIEDSTNAVSGGAVYEALNEKIEIIDILQADYDLLSEEEKNAENIIYNITDKNTDTDSLYEKISEIENKINSLEPSGINYDTYYNYRKIGKAVEIKFKNLPSTVLTTANGYTYLGTLPEEYRPSIEVVTTSLLDNAAGTLCIIKVQTDGVINLFTTASVYGRIWCNLVYYLD